MKCDFSDRASLLKAIAPLRDATFLGRELVHDAASRSVTLTLTRPDAAGRRPGGFFAGARRPSYLRTVVRIRRVVSYKQYLTAGPEDVYVLDRAEVERNGTEIALYFRPGDRAVMDVEGIEGMVEDAGKATSAPRRPPGVNPLAGKGPAGDRSRRPKG
ncbi:MAG TPA: hypothetical protein VJV23_07425 [Candidatus Polarisedimenticolia bacterium]|nr:hypothetical protein [Candidatus Polarisedimenticolia bacterium]